MGKLEQSFIKDIISVKNGFQRPHVVGPGYGIDTAVIPLTDTLAMAVASDPLSYIPQIGARRSAWLSLQLVSNDIATTSFAAQYGQFVLNLPEDIAAEALAEYWHYIDLFSKEMGITITGGHTGIVEGNRSTIAGGVTLWTIGDPDEMLLSSRASAGETLLMTKSAGLSAAAILATVFPQFTSLNLSTATAQRLQNEIWNISVSKEARIVKELNEKQPLITAMHDVTEGGIVGAVYEMCTASQLGVRLDQDLVPIAEDIDLVTALFQLDPLRCIGAGSMLMSCKTPYKNEVIKAMNLHAIACTEIGHFLEKEQGMLLYSDALPVEPLQCVSHDPYWAVFYKAMKDGLE